MKILISLPLYKREWILPKWFECIENQSIPLSNIGFQFELGPDDDETHSILWDWQSEHPECFIFDARINEVEDHAHHFEGQRDWKYVEYFRMVSFRNNLLDRATAQLGLFDRYFSLDSDILLKNPNTLEILSSHDRDVVSPLMFMTSTDKNSPNSMNWHLDGPKYVAKRNRLGTGLCMIDVPMAAVMMKPEVVERVRYIWHPQGEDVGFASNLHKQGFKSYIDHDIYTPHIMHRHQLSDYIKNGDIRG